MAASVSQASEREIYTVSRLNREVRALLERRYPVIWIEGELSNITRPASGHVYFSLKDRAAQIRCAMFRSRAMLARFPLDDGMQVLLHARVSLFEPRGDYQLIVEHVEPAGEGLLRIAFERLRAKLAAEGLFDPAHKQPIPRWPKRCGVITSPSGAAIRDVLAVLRRRFPVLPVIIYPVPVQGDAAAPAIVRAIQTANRRAECDVLILTRGGGSLQDLWPFNEEFVARAIYASRLPIVCGIGHEIDDTIADFVADVRAPTPSAAAELVAPDREAIWQVLERAEDRLIRGVADRMERLGEALDWYERRLPNPTLLVSNLRLRVQHLSERLPHALYADLKHRRAAVSELGARLHARHPRARLTLAFERHAQLAQRLKLAWARHYTAGAARIELLSRALHAVSPLATLGRGYAIVRDQKTGRVARDAGEFAAGDKVQARLQRGSLECTVDKSCGD